MGEIQVTDVINTIHQKWGQNAIQTASKISNQREILKTGFSSLDSLIVGVPQRSITQYVGQPTSGMTTLIYKLIAETQSKNQHIVYVDMGTSFSGGYAMSCGVDLDDVVLIEAQEESLVLDVLIEVVRSKLVSLVVLNLLSLKSIKLNWRKVLPEIWVSPCAVVILTQSHIYQDWVSLRLHVIHKQWVHYESDIVGCLSKITIDRHRYGNVGKSVVLTILFEEKSLS